MGDKIIERIFVTPGTEKEHKKQFPDHWERYEFAALLCPPGERILDVACGCGYGTSLLAQATGGILVGLDVDKYSINWANKYYSGNVKFLGIEDEKRWPIEDNSIDVVVSLETIEHVSDPENFLSEVKRILVNDGILILSTPINETEERFSPVNRFHVREYSWEELDNLLSKYFSVEKKFSQVSNLGIITARISNSPLAFIKKIIPQKAKKIITSMLTRFRESKTGKIYPELVAGASVQIKVAKK